MMRFLIPREPKARAKKNLAIDATNFCQGDPKMIRFLFPRAPKARDRRKFWILMRRTFGHIDPKMMRFSNSASAEGASEENLAI